MKRALMATIVTLVVLAQGTNAQATKPENQPEKVQLKVNGFDSWEEAYAAEAVRLTAMGLK